MTRFNDLLAGKMVQSAEVDDDDNVTLQFTDGSWLVVQFKEGYALSEVTSEPAGQEIYVTEADGTKHWF